MRITKLQITSGILSSSFLLLAAVGFGGNLQGNGQVTPDFNFLKAGRSLTQYLRATEEGRDFAAKSQLDPASLEQFLTPDRIRVVENPGLRSLSAATSSSIRLDPKVWADLGENPRTDYQRVASTLLLASGQSPQDAKDLAEHFAAFISDRWMITSAEFENLFPIVDAKAPAVRITSVQIGGTGCPNNHDTTATRIDSRRGVAELNFAEYYALAESAGTTDRKNCAVALSVDIPAGYKIGIEGIDVRGVFDLPEGSSLTASAETFLAGSRGPVINQKRVTLPGQRQAGRLLLQGRDTVWSACGKDSILRTNTSIQVSSPRGGDVAAGIVDRMFLKFRLKRC